MTTRVCNCEPGTCAGTQFTDPDFCREGIARPLEDASTSRACGCRDPWCRDCFPGARVRTRVALETVVSRVECIGTDDRLWDTMTKHEARLLIEGLEAAGYRIVPTDWVKEASANANA